jgi:hypothetical protein
MNLASMLTALVLSMTASQTPPRPFHFENDITPILTRFQCNTSGCHGNAEGQNGFKLSVFGFDGNADFNAILKDARGRRVMFGSPEGSLLLRKASGTMPHGGGTRLKSGTREYAVLRDWIAAGAPFGESNVPKIASLRVEPTEKLMTMGSSQPLKVIARFADGYELDATHWAKYQTNHDGIASVSEDGVVTVGKVPGEVAVMANYLNTVAVFRAMVPQNVKVASPKLPEGNVIDKHVNARLRKLNILPSELADDATFLRRAHLDIIGTLPTAAETVAYLDDSRPDKRARLIDRLLDRPEYADYWALLWADVLRIDRQALGAKNAHNYYRWLHRNLAANVPFDRFVRDIITAEGPLESFPAGNFFKATAKPGEMANSIAQTFLGVRIACAECHHHPYDRWSQTDYFGMVSFFTPLSLGKSDRGDILEVAGDPTAKHPRTGDAIYAHALGVAMPEKNPIGDRRLILADWLISADNPWFAKNVANRLWAHLLGRGIIEPVDDVRDTNPPSNPELLDALVVEVKRAKFDLKQIIRLIATSQTYQRSAKPLPENEKDETSFSRARFRRVPAEVLLDMVSQATGIGERYGGMPAGTRAVELWDSKTQHYFLKLFGRPQRVSTCSCERNHEASVAQVLHLFNSPEIQRKLSHDRGHVAKLTAKHSSDAELVDALYLTILSRRPTSSELDQAVSILANNPAERRQVAEDLSWSLLNTLEFAFNH